MNGFSTQSGSAIRVRVGFCRNTPSFNRETRASSLCPHGLVEHASARAELQRLARIGAHAQGWVLVASCSLSRLLW